MPSKSLSGSNKVSHLGADLGQQAFCQVLRGFLKEHRAKAQPAADGFFNDAEAFDGAATIFGAFRVRERLTEFLHQSIVAAFDPAEPLLGAGRSF